jgi:hypothetical protein
VKRRALGDVLLGQFSPSVVIPGREQKRANPESILPQECREKWIPGSMLRIAPE